MRNRIAHLAAAGILASILAVAPAAEATFPGDNGRILFSARKQGVYSVSLDGDVVRLTRKGIAPAASPSGDLLTFTRREGLFSLDLGTGERKQLTSPDRPYVDLGSAFAGPDGSRIVFTSRREADGGLGDTAIWSMDRNGSDLTPLTRLRDEPLYDDMVDSSPDGERLAFARRVRNKRWSEIYTMDADGGDVRRLTFSGEGIAYWPSFSPDGKRVLFTLYHGQKSVLATIPADGGKVRRITKPNEDVRHGVFSPNGRLIVASVPENGSGEPLVTMDLNGGHRHRITPKRFHSPEASGWIARGR